MRFGSDGAKCTCYHTRTSRTVIDYVISSTSLRSNVLTFNILEDFDCSDHYPLLVELDIDVERSEREKKVSNPRNKSLFDHGVKLPQRNLANEWLQDTLRDLQDGDGHSTSHDKRVTPDTALREQAKAVDKEFRDLKRSLGSDIPDLCDREKLTKEGPQRQVS
jgi:hypothetical protein